MSETCGHRGLWIVPCLWKSHDAGFPTATWKTLRVSHTPHNPDDEQGDISIELKMGTFLRSFDTTSRSKKAGELRLIRSSRSRES